DALGVALLVGLLGTARRGGRGVGTVGLGGGRVVVTARGCDQRERHERGEHAPDRSATRRTTTRLGPTTRRARHCSPLTATLRTRATGRCPPLTGQANGRLLF